MKTIYKYNLKSAFNVPQQIKMPAKGQVISVGNQKDNLCMWVRVDPEEPVVERSFIAMGTGHTFPKEANNPQVFYGTIQDTYGFVFHIFEIYK